MPACMLLSERAGIRGGRREGTRGRKKDGVDGADMYQCEMIYRALLPPHAH